MPSKRPKIRTATVKDAPELARIYTDAFAPVTAADVRRSMKRKDARAERIVAVVDGKVVASVTVIYFNLVVDGVPIRTGAIAGVATRWSYRRQGLATILMRAAIKRIKARGISNSTLFTGVQLPAKRIYERLGYSETSRWLRLADIRKPVDVLKRVFDERSRWLPRTPYAGPALKRWRERVLYDSDGWRATVTFDGKQFVVRAGRRGNPTIVMRGPTRPLIESFWNRFAYDRHVKRGTIRVVGPRGACEFWRRIVTLEWVE